MTLRRLTLLVKPMRLIAFDPSLLNLGVSVGRIEDGKLVVEYVTTYYIGKLTDKLSNQPDWEVDTNTRRVEMLSSIVSSLLNGTNPDMMVIELPIFNGKNPKSLQVQMKAITVLESMAIQFNNRFRTNIIEFMPNVIKQGVGINVKLEGGDKTAITRALVKLEQDGSLVYEQQKHRPNIVDEHANDSVAMLYTQFEEMRDVYI